MSSLWKLAVVAALVAVGISICGFYKIINEVHRSLNHADLVAKSISKNTLRVFKNFDQDDDGYLDIFEFQAASKYLDKKSDSKAFSGEEKDSDWIVCDISLVFFALLELFTECFVEFYRLLHMRYLSYIII